eukprot:m.471151 g.471151  ORF g.471151 m.471151 type:complete len:137 (+) comp20373_c0_seq14:1356-1766(+)
MRTTQEQRNGLITCNASFKGTPATRDPGRASLHHAVFLEQRQFNHLGQRIGDVDVARVHRVASPSAPAMLAMLLSHPVREVGVVHLHGVVEGTVISQTCVDLLDLISGTCNAVVALALNSKKGQERRIRYPVWKTR